MTIFQQTFNPTNGLSKNRKLRRHALGRIANLANYVNSLSIEQDAYAAYYGNARGVDYDLSQDVRWEYEHSLKKWED